jgi:hypothetical protein
MTAMTTRRSHDPRPLPPEQPGDDECCRSGCDPCIFDLYQQELQQYREALAQWEARQAEAGGQEPAR